MVEHDSCGQNRPIEVIFTGMQLGHTRETCGIDMDKPQLSALLRTMNLLSPSFNFVLKIVQVIKKPREPSIRMSNVLSRRTALYSLPEFNALWIRQKKLGRILRQLWKIRKHKEKHMRHVPFCVASMPCRSWEWFQMLQGTWSIVVSSLSESPHPTFLSLFKRYIKTINYILRIMFYLFYPFLSFSPHFSTFLFRFSFFLLRFTFSLPSSSLKPLLLLVAVLVSTGLARSLQAAAWSWGCIWKLHSTWPLALLGSALFQLLSWHSTLQELLNFLWFSSKVQNFVLSSAGQILGDLSIVLSIRILSSYLASQQIKRTRLL